MDCYRQTIMHRALFVPSFPLEKSLCILNLTVPSSFANLVVVFVVVSCIATAHSNSVGGVSGGYTHCSSANNPHCLMPYRNALRRAHGIGAVKPKLYRARGCLSVIPDNTAVRSICYIAAYIRNTNKHTIRKCDRERSGSIWRVSCICIYPLSIGKCR